MGKRGGRSRAKVGAMAALPVVGAAVAVAGTASPAAAAVIEDHPWTFVDNSSSTHNCVIRTERELPYHSHTQVGRGATSVLDNGDPACLQVTAKVTASWTDPSGNGVFLQFNSASASVERFYAPIGSNFHTYHEVTFDGCQSDCTAFYDRAK
jgi:hypothetical protein